MSRMTITRTIAVPLPLVFQTVSDIRQFSRALPHIVRVEFLSDVQSGVGARFRETRLMNGKEVATELAVTEYVPNERIRLVADNAGTVWDTLFTVQPQGAETLLTMTMDAKAYRILARVMNFLIFGLVRKAVEKDMDAVKAYCEKTAG